MLENLGTFQDGGLRYNNPLNIAIRKSRHIWPDKGEPDFVLSIGTGTVEPIPASTAIGPRSPVRDGFLRRLYATFMRDLDGERAWKEVNNTLSATSRARYHRLNLVLKGEEPQIDDVSVMSPLKEQAKSFIGFSAEAELVRDSLYASMFYFEPDDVPWFTGDVFVCVGHMFCRLDLDRRGREALYDRLASTSSFFLVGGRPVPCVQTVPRCLPPFKRRIQFTVKALAEELYISIRGITTRPRTISGLPVSVEDLLRRQALSAPFGRVDHARAQKALPGVPSKRRIEELE